jgi:hypothetical protein
MGHKTIIVLVMLLVLLAASSGQGQKSTEEILDSPKVAESPSDQNPLLVDYEAVPTTDIARQELSALRVQDLHAEHVVAINSEGEITVIELTSGQESTIKSEGLVVEGCFPMR